MKTIQMNPKFMGPALISTFLIIYISPSASQSGNVNSLSDTSGNLFNFIRKIEVKSNDHFSDNTVPGVSSNEIFYIPMTGNFVVMLKTSPPKTPIPLPPLTESDHPCLDSCPLGTLGYQELDTDLQPTANHGYLICDIGDWNSRVIDNNLYLVKVWNKGPGTADFWRLFKYDIETWEELGTVDIPLDSLQEWSDGPTISFINGMITISGEYFPGGTPDGPKGRGSHHHFLTPDLQLMGKKILVSPDVPPHCPESTLRQIPNGNIIMFTASAYYGDLIVMILDKNWNFVEKHLLRSKAFFPLGAVNFGGYWFVAYNDLSKRFPGPPWPEGDPPIANVALAAFDTDWNLIQDEIVTDFDTVPDSVGRTEAGGSWVELLGNHLYVSYTVMTFTPIEYKIDSEQTFVNEYELTIPDMVRTQTQCDESVMSSGYPNPFSSSISFSVNMPESGELIVFVFDQLGQKVAILSDIRQPAGSYILNWDGTDNSGKCLMNGIYYVQCMTRKYSTTRKVVMIR